MVVLVLFDGGVLLISLLPLLPLCLFPPGCFLLVVSSWFFQVRANYDFENKVRALNEQLSNARDMHAKEKLNSVQLADQNQALQHKVTQMSTARTEEKTAQVNTEDVTM